MAENPKHGCALLLIFFSHRYMRKKVLVQPVQELLAPYERELMPKFYFVFNENKQLHRLRFFQDPMVKVLWA